MAKTAFGTFKFIYAPDEAVEGNLIGFADGIGFDECDPDGKFRKHKPNGEKYFVFVSEYVDQQRLAAGHIGFLKFQVPSVDVSVECEAVVTSTTLRRIPAECDEGLFEEDGSLKLIQKFTVTT